MTKDGNIYLTFLAKIIVDLEYFKVIFLDLKSNTGSNKQMRLTSVFFKERKGHPSK
jgi:hypothetical protein